MTESAEYRVASVSAAVDGQASREIAGEAADEGVAGPGGVDRLNLDGRDRPRAFARCDERPARAERHDDRLDALADQALRRGGDLGFGFHRHVGEDAELGLVGDEETRVADGAHVEVAPRGRRVEHGLNAVPPAEAKRRIGGFKLDLELEQDEIAKLELLARGFDVGCAQVAVRSCDDEDRIVARLLVDQDRRGAGRLVRDAPDMARVDPVALEILERALAEAIVAEIGDHHHFGAKLGCGDRLIGALAAETRLEVPGEDRLAPDGHALDRGRQIHVRRADDSDARALAPHCSSSSKGHRRRRKATRRSSLSSRG